MPREGAALPAENVHWQMHAGIHGETQTLPCQIQRSQFISAPEAFRNEGTPHGLLKARRMHVTDLSMIDASCHLTNRHSYLDEAVENELSGDADPYRS